MTILLILTSPGFGERDLDYILQNHCSKSFHSRNCIKSLKVILVDGLYFINWLHDSWCYTAVSALIMINIIIKLNCNMFNFFLSKALVLSYHSLKKSKSYKLKCIIFAPLYKHLYLLIANGLINLLLSNLLLNLQSVVFLIMIWNI